MRSPTVVRVATIGASPAIRLRHDPAARLRLFCLPHAGAGASLFHPWSLTLPREIQVCPIQQPGRENRLRERPHTGLPALVRDLVDAVVPYLDLPFALFGHSMGAAIGFELARELRRQSRSTPLHLLMSGFRAPHRRPTSAPLAALPNPMFLEAVQQRYGRIADEILRESALVDLIMPVLRADLAMIETYCCTEEAPLDCAISVFGGASDPTVTEDELMDWSRHTTVGFDFCTLPGGHFFPQESRDQLLSALDHRLQHATRRDATYLREKSARPNPTSGDGW
jgi:surfactin synthase thioesterase subunit